MKKSLTRLNLSAKASQMSIQKVNWQEAEQDYLTGNLSFRDIAVKYGVSVTRVGVKGKQLDWYNKKKKAWKEANKNISKAIEIVSQNKAEELVDKVTAIKLRQLQDSEQLIEKGKQRLLEEPISDSVAFNMVKHGQETIRELEGLKQAPVTQNIIVISDQEKTERLKRIAEEYKELEE